MRKVLLCAAVLTGHVAAVDGMYYLGGLRSSLAESVVVVWFISTVGAFVLYWMIFRASRRRPVSALTLAAAEALALTFLGFYVAMVIALNTWGS